MSVKNSSWAALVGFAILLLLGLGIPFLMEYKSVTNPPYVRRPDAGKRTVLDQGKKYYCPACGSELALPSWDASPKPADQASTLSLRSLTTTSLDISRTHRPRAEISGEAP